jgi:hypothetical protein
VLGLFLVSLAWFSSGFAGQAMSAFVGPANGDLVADVVLGLLPPGIFGFWVGLRRKNLRFTTQMVPFGLLVGLAVALAQVGSIVVLAAYYGIRPAGISDWAGPAVNTALTGWFFYVSGVLIGNARQRRRIRRISGRTPASPVSRAGQGAGRQPRKDLTPTKQAMLGWGGAIIGALINLVGTVIG